MPRDAGVLVPWATNRKRELDLELKSKLQADKRGLGVLRIVTGQISFHPRPRGGAFSFALHLLRVQGFCFALLQYSPIQAFTADFITSMQLYHPRYKTAYMALQGLFLRFFPFNRPRFQTDTSGYNTTCATLKRITAPVRHTPIPDSSATPDTVQVSTACYYKRYIRVRSLLLIHAKQCSISQTMIARRGLLLSCVDRWQVLHPEHLLRGQRLHLYRVIPAARARRAARNHWRLPPQLFSGFRPIANRGQQ